VGIHTAQVSKPFILCLRGGWQQLCETADFVQQLSLATHVIQYRLLAADIHASQGLLAAA
jgi:hypothetical protein